MSKHYRLSIPTKRMPSDSGMAVIFRNTYQQISVEQNEKWILTGYLLERIALDYGIHPIVSRKMINNIFNNQKFYKIKIYFEGSTPETRFYDHYVKVDGVRVNLYDGLFLIPGISSVRIKVVKDEEQ